jgi:DNA polymerase-3 subunit epsilon
LKRGVVIDTETTGTDIANDKMIDLGKVVFSYDANSGQVHRVLETICSPHQNPGRFS